MQIAGMVANGQLEVGVIKLALRRANRLPVTTSSTLQKRIAAQSQTFTGQGGALRAGACWGAEMERGNGLRAGRLPQDLVRVIHPAQMAFWTRLDGLVYHEAMNTNVTELSVRDSDGNIRSLLVSTKSGEGGEASVEYNLGTLPVTKQEDGTFKVSETGEVLTVPEA